MPGYEVRRVEHRRARDGCSGREQRVRRTVEAPRQKVGGQGSQAMKAAFIAFTTPYAVAVESRSHAGAWARIASGAGKNTVSPRMLNPSPAATLCASFE